jgi:hypothetical protein
MGFRWIGDNMHNEFVRFAMAGLVTFCVSLACGVGNAAGPNAAHTQVAVTIYALQTEISASGTAEQVSSSSTPTTTATATPTPIVFVTAQNPVVIHDTLCWLGPGPGFEVSSAVHAGTRVILLGYGSIPGWWVISDPVYHDPCWMYQQDLQIDLTFDMSGLRVFYPPPTPTSTRTPKPTNTPTPTP